jgi:GNAT superfamily N-acetyltransferase
VDRSDKGLSAWKRLRTRYPVKNIKMKNGNQYDRIDLTKVLVKESIIVEEPDFGYKHFVNRDADIAKLRWAVVKDEGGISVWAKYVPNDETQGFIIARPFEELNNSMQITVSNLRNNEEWRNTGLGQMLYDRLIKEVKKSGYDYLYSDYKLSPFARTAWGKLSRRYPVEKVKIDGENLFRIDLK